MDAASPMSAVRSCVTRAIAASVFVAALSGPAFALSRDRAISQFHHTAWTAKDGAPSQISALAQTEDGYLWIGTARGLFRFDGVRFERYHPPPGISLPAHNVYSLLATPDGGLWVSFRPSGVGFFKDGKATIFSRPSELPTSQVYALARDLEGGIWAGTHDGLAMLTGSKWTPIGTAWNFPPERIRALLVDREGTLWVATETTVHFLRRGSKQFVPTRAVVNGVTSLEEGPSGDIWVAEIGYGHFRPLVSGPSSRWGDFRVGVDSIDALIDRDGAFWLVRAAAGICRIRFPEQAPRRRIDAGERRWIDHYKESDGLTGDVASALLEDREGNIWVGTAKGLDRFRYNAVVPVALPPAHQKLTLLAGEAGEIWAASAAHHLLARVRSEEIDFRNVHFQISSVHRDDRGDVWWGGAGGVVRQRGEEVTLFQQPADTPSDYVWEIVRADEGGLWMGLGDVGLVHFDDGVWSRRPPPAGLLSRVPSATFQDAQGRIWFGYTENRVRVLDRGTVRAYSSSDGLAIGRIRVIRGGGSRFWVGGELGLALFEAGRFRTVVTSSGEGFGTVSGIVQTADGAVWLNEMRGIVRIPPDEVRKLVGSDHRVSFELFDFLDGLPGAPQMNWTVSTAIQATDGRLWFATDNGLAWTDPSKRTRNLVPPPVRIESVVADRTYAPGESLVFPVGTEKVDIRYTALSLSMPERVTFRYQLEGVDKDWQEAGTRRETFYTPLRPGHYTFRVKAANNDGVWNDSGATIEFRIRPAFHQTPWFVLLCVAGGAAAMLLIYGLRMRQIAARLQRLHDERMDERVRIAHELHDTLLQGFLSVSMHLHVAVSRMPDDSPARPVVSTALTLIGEVSEEGRQALQGLRLAENEEPLEQAFSRTRRELAVERKVGFRVLASGQSRSVHASVRDEIYRIGREALLNAFRHAEAENIEVELEYLDRRLILRIRDDGRGIDSSVLRSGRADHWGLAGMRERAERLGGQLKVTSRTGAGTEIELTVPGRLAYRRPRSEGWLRALMRRLTTR